MPVPELRKPAVPASETVKVLTEITTRLQHGATVSEVNEAYEAHEFPELESIQSQMALTRAVERTVGHSALINQILTQECAETKAAVAKIGFKAFMSTLETEGYKTEEVITNFQPSDLEEEAVKEQYAKLMQQTNEHQTAQVDFYDTLMFRW